MTSVVLALIGILTAVFVGVSFTLQLADRFRLRRSLQQLEQDLSLTEDVARLGYWKRSMDANRATWSDGTYEVFGETRADFVPSIKNIRAHFFAEDLDRLRAMTDPAKIVGAGREDEFRIRCPDGTLKDIVLSVRYRFNRAGKHVGIFGIVADITSRKQAERATAKHEELLTRALNAAEAGTWEVDFLRREVQLSPRWAQMLGYDAEGRRITTAEYMALVHPDDARQLTATTSEMEQTSYSYEYRMRHKKGHYVWVQVRGRVVEFLDGQRRRAVGTIIDVSERRAATDRLARTARDANLLHAATLLAINSTTVDDVIQRTIDLVCETTSWPAGIAFIVPGTDATELRPMDIWRDPNKERHAALRDINKGITFRPGKGLPGEVWLSRRPTWVSDIHDDDRFTHFQAIPALESLRAAAAFPIVIGDEVRIVLEFFSETVMPPDDDLLRVFGTLGLQLGSLIKRLEAEEEVRRGRESLALAIEASQAGHFEVDLRTQATMWSPRAMEILGIDRTVSPASLVQLIHPDDLSEFLAETEQFRLRHAPIDAELRLRHSSGRYIWIQVRIIYVKEGAGTNGRVVGLINDISAAKAAQQAVADSERKFRALVEQSLLGIIVSRNFKPLFCNAAFAKILGYAGSEDVCALPSMLPHFPPDELEAAPDSWRRAMAGEWDGVLRKHQLISRDGRRVWLESMGRIISWEGEPALQQIISDITQRVEREAELAAARDSLKAQAEELAIERERAERANAAKSRFLAMMSHELRTPMTGVLGMADLLLLSGLNKEQKDLMNLLTRSARALLDLLNDILDFSKIEAGQLEIETIPFRISEILSDVRNLFAPIASEKGLTLDARLPPTYLDVVLGDPKRLRQVLSNLVSNAIKFTESGGIAMELGQEKVSDGKVRLLLTVNDTGIGMAPEDTQRLFQPFVQADISTSRKYGGTGLGLAICRRLVQSMGGAIDVTTEPGKGSSFHFSVMVGHDPTARVKALTPRDGSILPTTTAKFSSRTILVAEDNETSRYLISLMLERLGHAVRAVNDGAQAFAAVQESPFDIVLMDMQMPVMDGTEAMRAIRALNTPVAKIPIIALTADVVSDHRDMYLSAGAHSVVAKPVDWIALDAEIARLTDAFPMTIPSLLASQAGSKTDAKPKSKEAAASRPNPGAAAMSAAILDEGALQSLSDVLGESALNAMLVNFNGNMRKYRDDLNEAVSQGNLRQAKRTAHALKGLCAQFGAIRVSDLAKKIEVDAVSLDDVKPVMPDLMACIVDTENALAARDAASTHPSAEVRG